MSSYFQIPLGFLIIYCYLEIISAANKLTIFLILRRRRFQGGEVPLLFPSYILHLRLNISITAVLRPDRHLYFYEFPSHAVQLYEYSLNNNAEQT